MALIQAKQEEYIARLDMVDLKYQFKDVKCKWQKIVDFVNASGHSPLPRNNDACKDNWGAIYRDFKCINL